MSTQPALPTRVRPCHVNSPLLFDYKTTVTAVGGSARSATDCALRRPLVVGPPIRSRTRAARGVNHLQRSGASRSRRETSACHCRIVIELTCKFGAAVEVGWPTPGLVPRQSCRETLSPTRIVLVTGCGSAALPRRRSAPVIVGLLVAREPAPLPSGARATDANYESQLENLSGDAAWTPCST